jgi:hypothetical protein
LTQGPIVVVVVHEPLLLSQVSSQWLPVGHRKPLVKLQMHSALLIVCESLCSQSGNAWHLCSLRVEATIAAAQNWFALHIGPNVAASSEQIQAVVFAVPPLTLVQ